MDDYRQWLILYDQGEHIMVYTNIYRAEDVESALEDCRAKHGNSTRAEPADKFVPIEP